MVFLEKTFDDDAPVGPKQKITVDTTNFPQTALKELGWTPDTFKGGAQEVFIGSPGGNENGPDSRSAASSGAKPPGGTDA